MTKTKTKTKTVQRQSRDSPETFQRLRQTETALSNVHDSSVLKSEQFALYIWEKVMTVSDTVSDILQCLQYSVHLWCTI